MKAHIVGGRFGGLAAAAQFGLRTRMPRQGKPKTAQMSTLLTRVKQWLTCAG
jgi:hypothetical protein